MASTNFTQHNPSAANQQTDGAFDGDSLSTGGIGVDAIMPSDWMNKRWYQDSTMVTALALALANKGYSTSDANISTLVSVLGNIITNNDLKPNLFGVPFSPTPTFNAALTNGFAITLAGNVTSSALINLTFGQLLTFNIFNPGGFSFVWPTNVLDPLPLNPNAAIGNNTQQFIVLSDGNAYSVVSTVEAILAGKQANLGFAPVQQGTGIGQLPNLIKIGWNGTRLKATVDVTDLGNVVFDSQLNGRLPNTLTQRTPGNNFGTIFQNNSLGDRRVVVVGSIMFGVGHSATLLARTGPSAGAISTVAVQSITNSSGFGSVSFTVPQGWFYQVITGPGLFSGDSNAATLTNWTEWEYA